MGILISLAIPIARVAREEISEFILPIASHKTFLRRKYGKLKLRS